MFQQTIIVTKAHSARDVSPCRRHTQMHTSVPAM
jgi:hypothetical protein